MREELSEKYELSKKRNWPKMESQGVTFQGCTGKPTKKTEKKKKKGQKSVNRGWKRTTTTFFHKS